jgi:hypothetical protein
MILAAIGHLPEIEQAQKTYGQRSVRWLDVRNVQIRKHSKNSESNIYKFEVYILYHSVGSEKEGIPQGGESRS